MRLSVAQTRPIKGDIHRNITSHERLIDLAVSGGADVVIFPELSLTGYEPTLANALATAQEDTRFDRFQTISDSKNVTVGVGIPTLHSTGVCISMVLFQSHKARMTYSKRHLHLDEEPFFVSGHTPMHINVADTIIAPAICYELSVAEHAEKAFRSGAAVYIASVAKTANGLEAAIPRLADIARIYSMTALMSNCVGECDGCECAGQTSVWNTKGVLVGQLNDRDEGVLIIDIDTQEVIEKTL
jgi:predicted amidohydrolase